MAVNPGYGQASAGRPGWGWLTLLFLIALVLCALWIWADQQKLQYQWIIVSAVLVALCMIAGWLVNGRSDGILIDDRNRLSLSRLQWVVWIIVLLGGYFAAAVWNVAYMADWAVKGHFPQMQPDLWALLGIVSGSAIASNLIVDRKKLSNGQSGSQPAPGQPAPQAQASQLTQIGSMDRNVTPADASWGDLFLGEEVANRDVVDISRLQKLFVTLLLVVAYIRLLWVALGTPDPTMGIDMPPVSNMPRGSDEQGGQGFLWLLGISHAAYLASKATPKSGTSAGGAPDAAADQRQQPVRPTTVIRPAEDEGTDGCDVDFKVNPTSDEELPVATGGVA